MSEDLQVYCFDTYLSPFTTRSICRCSLPKGVDMWTLGATHGDGETSSETLMQPRLKLCPPWCLLLLFQAEEHNCRGIPMISG